MMMKENFELLLPRIIDCNNKVDYKGMISQLKKIRNSCICIGTGGSQAVSQYASKILNTKNNIIAQNMEPRDVLYTNLKPYKNICAFSYGGDNEGIERALERASEFRLNRCVFTSEDRKLKYILNEKGKDSLINYCGNIEKEYSFISLASTLIPMSLLLRYYLDGSSIDFYAKLCHLHTKALERVLDASSKIPFEGVNRLEINGGDFTYTACKVLESNMVEAGLMVPTTHEKYSVCHGRTTLAHHHPEVFLVHLINKRKEIDKFLLEVNCDLYKSMIIISTDESDELIGEYDLALKAMLLSRIIAESSNKDLSKVEYAPQVKKLYRFRGEM